MPRNRCTPSARCWSIPRSPACPTSTVAWLLSARGAAGSRRSTPAGARRTATTSAWRSSACSGCSSAATAARARWCSRTRAAPMPTTPSPTSCRLPRRLPPRGLALPQGAAHRRRVPHVDLRRSRSAAPGRRAGAVARDRAGGGNLAARRRPGAAALTAARWRSRRRRRCGRRAGSRLRARSASRASRGREPSRSHFLRRS